jgi:dephospho-CoA kinase
MKVIGLTGSIGMGKSTTADLFRRRLIPVFDADQTVHRLTAPKGPALAALAAAFPGTVSAGRLDRQALGARVFDDVKALKKLESILHPLVAHARATFLRRARAQHRPLVVLDVPLLFETHGDKATDTVVVVTCPHFLQKQRALARPGMTEAKFRAIERSQMPDRDKRRRADHIIQTGRGKRPVIEQIARICRQLAEGQKNHA